MGQIEQGGDAAEHQSRGHRQGRAGSLVDGDLRPDLLTPSGRSVAVLFRQR
jgi:hypothetical protein